MYSRLFHTIPSEEAINRARICLMKKLEWRRIAMATSSSDDYYAKVSLKWDKVFLVLLIESRINKSTRIYINIL